jgi:hypothetical protein
MGVIDIKYIKTPKTRKPRKTILLDLPIKLIGESSIPRRKKMHPMTKPLFCAFNIIYPNSPISDDNKEQACNFVLNLPEFKYADNDLLKEAIEIIPDATNKDVETYNIKQILSKSLVKVLMGLNSEYPYFKNLINDQIKFRKQGLTQFIHERLKDVLQ